MWSSGGRLRPTRASRCCCWVLLLASQTWIAEGKYQRNKYSPQTDQSSVRSRFADFGDPPNLQEQIKAAIRDVMLGDGANGNVNSKSERAGRGRYSMNGNGGPGGDVDPELPLHEPSGQRTRKTYDFTRSFHVGLSCHDIQASQGARRSGVYLVHPPNLAQGPWRVLCDLESEGGGWTVFQTRDDVEPRENFMRGWEDYKVGFGDFDREFWLGNILLWALTNADNGTTQYELSVELEDWSGNRRFARYRSFRLTGERDGFRLRHRDLFYGNAGDSLHSHNGLPFSTFDVDNDSRESGDFAERSCARLYKGGWWYGNCHDSNLNGWSLRGPHRSFADGINWYTWTGYNYSLKKTVMKIRPQIAGPIDIGYGNFILTSPNVPGGGQGSKGKSNGHTRAGRHMKSDDEEENDDDDDDQDEFDGDGRLDVSELLDAANTLTHPDNFEEKAQRRRRRSVDDEL